MRAAPVLLTVTLLTAGAAFLLTPRRFEAPATDQIGVGMDHVGDPGRDSVRAQGRTTGKLVIRVGSEEGSPMTSTTREGKLRYGDRRLRFAATDGTFPFADAPVGRLEVTAEAAGYLAPAVTAVLTPGVPTEATIVLAPVR